jgi:hypothetical protein
MDFTYKIVGEQLTNKIEYGWDRNLAKDPILPFLAF